MENDSSAPDYVDEHGVTRMPCPACGSVLKADGECTNEQCPGREESDRTDMPVQSPGRIIADDLEDDETLE